MLSAGISHKQFDSYFYLLINLLETIFDTVQLNTRMNEMNSKLLFVEFSSFDSSTIINYPTVIAVCLSVL